MKAKHLVRHEYQEKHNVIVNGLIVAQAKSQGKTHEG